MFDFLKSSYKKVKNALLKTRSLLSQRIKALFGKPWDDSTFDSLEQILFESDLGSTCATGFVEHLRSVLRKKPTHDITEILKIIRDHALSILSAPPRITHTTHNPSDPRVILIVGVNGSGKTTTIAKLAHQFQKNGKKVLLATGDTFRAAAIDQLDSWATRLNVDIVKGKPGSDPSAVAFDALTAAKTRKADVVLIDTAGRLQNKTHLMQELEKIRRTCAKVVPNSPHETFLVLDATTGQNAIDQATVFHQFTPLTGLILAKLDGSAKGGIILSIYQQLGIPVRWIGVGESSDDLEPFDPNTYVDALFDMEP